MNDEFSLALTVARCSDTIIDSNEFWDRHDQMEISSLFVWAAEILKRDPRYYDDAVTVAANAVYAATAKWEEDGTIINTAVDCFVALAERSEQKSGLSNTKKAEQLIQLYSRASLQFGDTKTQAAQKLVGSFERILPEIRNGVGTDEIQRVLKKYISIDFPEPPTGELILDEVARKHLPVVAPT